MQCWGSAIIGELVLGFVNAVVRPLLVLLTLPFTILTFGLLLLVVNALMLWLVRHPYRGSVFRVIRAPPDERGGNRQAKPNTTASHLYFLPFAVIQLMRNRYILCSVFVTHSGILTPTFLSAALIRLLVS